MNNTGRLSKRTLVVEVCSSQLCTRILREVSGFGEKMSTDTFQLQYVMQCIIIKILFPVVFCVRSYLLISYGTDYVRINGQDLD